MSERVCLDCKADISGRHGKALRCVGCGQEKIRANSRAWAARNYESTHAWSKAHPEYFRAWRAANLEKRRDYNIAWRAANPGKKREHHRARRATKRNQLGVVTPGIELTLIARQKYRCAAPGCGKRVGGRLAYHLDHITPLAKGGLHDDTNLQILCAPCNMSKGAKEQSDFARERGMLL